MKYDSGPNWPTKAVREHKRRRNKAGRGGSGLIGSKADTETPISRAIVRELRAERLGAPVATPARKHSHVNFGRMGDWAWVKYPDGSEVCVKEIRSGWDCAECGRLTTPCEHVRIVTKERAALAHRRELREQQQHITVEEAVQALEHARKEPA